MVDRLKHLGRKRAIGRRRGKAAKAKARLILLQGNCYPSKRQAAGNGQAAIKAFQHIKLKSKGLRRNRRGLAGTQAEPPLAPPRG